jgi:hypothetical protein
VFEFACLAFSLVCLLITLWDTTVAEKLNAEGKQEVYKHEEMEELEDDEGNVYSYKVRFSSDAGFPVRYLVADSFARRTDVP